MRPPLRRYSSVSIANHSFSDSRARWAASSASAWVRPCSIAPAASSTSIAWPPHAERLSRTSIRSPPLPSAVSCRLACTAESQVPEMPAERWIEITPPPSSRSGS